MDSKEYNTYINAVLIYCKLAIQNLMFTMHFTNTTILMYRDYIFCVDTYKNLDNTYVGTYAYHFSSK